MKESEGEGFGGAHGDTKQEEEKAKQVVRLVLTDCKLGPCGHQLVVAPAMLRTAPMGGGPSMKCCLCDEGQVSFICSVGGVCGFRGCSSCIVEAFSEEVSFIPNEDFPYKKCL